MICEPPRGLDPLACIVMVPAVDRAGRRDLRSAGSADTGIAASAGLMRLRAGDGFEMFTAGGRWQPRAPLRTCGEAPSARKPTRRTPTATRGSGGRLRGPLHREARRTLSSRQREIRAQVFCMYLHGAQKLKEPREPARPLRGGQDIARLYLGFGPGPTTEQRYTSSVVSRVISPACAAARTSASEVNW